MGPGALPLRKRRGRRSGTPLAALVATILLVGGCGGSTDGESASQLCANYDEIVAIADDFTQLEASETSTDELRAAAVDLRDRLDALQESASSERIAEALSQLQQSLDAARERADEAGEKAEDRVASAEESLQEVSEKWAGVRAMVDDRCD